MIRRKLLALLKYISQPNYEVYGPIWVNDILFEKITVIGNDFEFTIWINDKELTLSSDVLSEYELKELTTELEKKLADFL